MNENILKLIKSINNSYVYKRSDNLYLNILGRFLINDVDSVNIDFFINWAQDLSQKETGGNISFLEKENSKIMINDLISEAIDSEMYLQLSSKNFIDIMEKWKILMQEAPSQILITMKDGVVNLEGKN